MKFLLFLRPFAQQGGNHKICPEDLGENCGKEWVFFLFVFLFCFVLFFRAALVAFGGSQARGRIRAAAAGLHYSHSHSGFEPCLKPTPQLTGMTDPPREVRVEPISSWILSDAFPLCHDGNSRKIGGKNGLLCTDTLWFSWLKAFTMSAPN